MAPVVDVLAPRVCPRKAFNSPAGQVLENGSNFLLRMVNTYIFRECPALLEDGKEYIKVFPPTGSRPLAKRRRNCLPQAPWTPPPKTLKGRMREVMRRKPGGGGGQRHNRLPGIERRIRGPHGASHWAGWAHIFVWLPESTPTRTRYFLPRLDPKKINAMNSPIGGVWVSKWF